MANEQEIRETASQDRGEALNTLGCNYYYGRDGQEQDVKKAFTAFAHAVKEGDSLAKCHLGYCYVYGKGRKRKKIIGIRWLKEAAKEGCTEAMNFLGVHLLFGWKMERITFKNRSKDYRNAFELFQQGASLDPACLHNLATCYEFAIGVPSNPEEGARLHAIANKSIPKERDNVIEELLYQFTPAEARALREVRLSKKRKVEPTPLKIEFVNVNFPVAAPQKSVPLIEIAGEPVIKRPCLDAAIPGAVVPRSSRKEDPGVKLEKNEAAPQTWTWEEFVPVTEK